MFDLQINGLTLLDKGIHCDFWQAPSDEAIAKLEKYFASEGVTGFYATLITSSYAEMDKNLARITEYLSRNPSSLIAGVHIEGGLITKEGIHPTEYLQEFDLVKTRSLIEKYPGLIKLWTLCPLADKNGVVTKYLQSQSVRVAYGHSKASHQESEKAFDSYGVDLVTHWPNAMVVVRDPSNSKRFDHRNPSTEYLEFLAKDKETAISWAQENNLELGLGFTAYHRKNINLTLIYGSIADKDLHVAPELVKMVSARKQPSQVILVSDAVAYDEAELKAGQALALRGGRTSLAKHRYNYQKEIS